MPFGRKGQTSELYIVPQPADKQPMTSPPLGDVHEISSVAVEIIERWGFDTRLTGELARELNPRSAGIRSITSTAHPARHTTDFVKSDLLGMAGQRFEDAARVWESAQWKSDKLRPRTLESLADYLNSLNKFFKNVPHELDQTRHAEGIPGGASLQCHRSWWKDSSSLEEDGRSLAHQP